MVEKITRACVVLSMVALMIFGLYDSNEQEPSIQHVYGEQTSVTAYQDSKPIDIQVVALKEVVEEQPQIPFTEEEIDEMAIITMAEAEGEPEKGQRLVIDTILNRVDSEHFPDTVHDVIYQKNQFSSVWDGRADRCYVMDDIRNLVLEEIEERTDSDVIFFRTERYSDYGTPLYKEGNHYFSSY